MMLEAVKKDEDDMLNQFTERDVARLEGVQLEPEKLQYTNGKALVPSFPAYTKTIKKQNQQRFGAQDTNPVFAISMQKALERHEQSLMEKAMALEQEKTHF